MQTRFVVLAVTALILVLVAPAAGARPQGSPDEGAEWIVTLKPGADPRSLAEALSARAGGQPGFIYDNVLGGFSFEGDGKAARAMLRSPAVASVSPVRQFVLADTPGTGVLRIDGDEAHAIGNGAYTGSGVRVVVIDSGVDLDHPDLVANLDIAAGANCDPNASSPDDDNGHGTHVAGIAAADDGPGSGVVGVAPVATIVPIKVFSANGSAGTAEVMCGLNHAAGLMADGLPTVVNMSWVSTDPAGACVVDGQAVIDPLHQAICDLDAAGAVLVAAAGNSSTSAASSFPAAYEEVISVSAWTDFNGVADAAAGCRFDFFSFFFDCDDTFASYSNYGGAVDVMAPGTAIRSSVPGGGSGEKSGTSMAAPHVAGVAAAMLSANDALTTAQVRAILQRVGECPSPIGSINAAGTPICEGQGQWPDDPDGLAEPLVNANRAVQFVVDLGPGPVDLPPTAAFSAYCATEHCSFTDTSTDFESSVVSWSWDFGDGATSTLQFPEHTYAAAGTYTVTLTVHDTAGGVDAVSQAVAVPTPWGPWIQGDWVGVYGADGYVLSAFEGGGTADVVWFPFGSVSLDQGRLFEWTEPGIDDRALEDPSGSFRRSATWWDGSRLRVSLDFFGDYVGSLHLYAVDWDGAGRTQVVTVDDGSGPQVVDIAGSFEDGAWMHFDVDVVAGDTVTITVDRTGNRDAVLSGIFLGDEVATPPPP